MGLAMLTHLIIRDVVLIEKLELDLPQGLCALTGETGAGKSIFLDALSLVCGARSDAGMIRKGSDTASVTATFHVAPTHAAYAFLKNSDIEIETGEDLIVRRNVGLDGRSRASVNDQPVSIGLLRQLGDMLVDIHGQFETQGLLDPKTHRVFLDAFAGNDKRNAAVSAAWANWQDLIAQRAAILQKLEVMRRDQEYWEASLADLETLQPAEGEEDQLLSRRATLSARELLGQTFGEARDLIEGDRNGAMASLNRAFRTLDRVAAKAGDRLDPVLQGLDRAMSELRDAGAVLESWFDAEDATGETLEHVDDRLHGLRAQARKHQVQIDELPRVMETMRTNLATIRGDDGQVAVLDRAIVDAEKTYTDAANALDETRRKSADKLDRSVMAELKPLKLERALFRTAIETLPPEQWGPAGINTIRFEVATNPGAPFGMVHKVASGGELSRFMLALKVVLAAGEGVPTLVFDEVDSGIGGATAAAVGERLARLAEQRQVLVVTHSPQVAARADHHWTVAKSLDATGAMRTMITQLETKGDRAEEIARMLSGAAVTDEARAAASSLLKTGT